MLLGRQLVYPVELKKKDIDFSGTKMTQPLVDKLMKIHDDVFGVAAKNIEKHQRKYKAKFDKVHKAQKFKLKKGSKVQVKKHKSKSPKGHFGIKWHPARSFYTISKVDKKKRRVFLKTKDGRALKYSRPFERIRKYTGTF